MKNSTEQWNSFLSAHDNNGHMSFMMFFWEMLLCTGYMHYGKEKFRVCAGPCCVCFSCCLSSSVWVDIHLFLSSHSRSWAFNWVNRSTCGMETVMMLELHMNELKAFSIHRDRKAGGLVWGFDSRRERWSKHYWCEMFGRGQGFCGVS